MALGSRTCRSPCVNSSVDPAGELDELASAQGPAKRSPAEDFFMKFMKVFMETTQAQALVEP